MSYRDRLKKKVTLPSGATIIIKKLNSFCEPFLNKKQTDEERQDASLRKMLANPENGFFIVGEESFRIVDKPEASSGEIRIEELEQADVNALCKEIIEFSGLDKAGQEARDTFLKGQEAGGDAPSNIKNLRTPSDGTSAAIAG